MMHVLTEKPCLHGSEMLLSPMCSYSSQDSFLPRDTFLKPAGNLMSKFKIIIMVVESCQCTWYISWVAKGFLSMKRLFAWTLTESGRTDLE